MRIPILRGRLRGALWLLESHGKVLRVLTGAYEPEQSALFARWVRPGHTVLDCGAHAGYYSLLASRLVGERGLVWAFEPEPSNNAILRRNLAINHAGNVRVSDCALSDTSGRARFAAGSGSGTGHLAPAGGVDVRTTSLDDFCTAEDLNPDVIKLDVEGAEAMALHGSERVIAASRPVIFLSTHGETAHRESLAILHAHDYAVAPILGGSVECSAELLCLPGRAV